MKTLGILLFLTAIFILNFSGQLLILSPDQKDRLNNSIISFDFGLVIGFFFCKFLNSEIFIER
jgi:hypothetical protein